MRFRTPFVWYLSYFRPPWAAGTIKCNETGIASNQPRWGSAPGVTSDAGQNFGPDRGVSRKPERDRTAHEAQVRLGDHRLRGFTGRRRGSARSAQDAEQLEVRRLCRTPWQNNYAGSIPVRRQFCPAEAAYHPARDALFKCGTE